jgi:hypothetical protein
VTNPLKNDYKNANSLAHDGVHLVMLHICKGEEVGEVLEKLELQKRSDGSWIGILY